MRDENNWNWIIPPSDDDGLTERYDPDFDDMEMTEEELLREIDTDSEYRLDNDDDYYNAYPDWDDDEYLDL